MARQRDVAILGSGPAGLLAALAAEQTGFRPRIYSLGDKSPMFGAMYLHQPIPVLTGDLLEPDFKIDVLKNGTRDGYATKVYGNPQADCSWDVIAPGPTPAWNLHRAYDSLWNHYGEEIEAVEITSDFILKEIVGHEMIFSTIPAKCLCRRDEHNFVGQEITVAHGPQKTVIVSPDGNENIMLYNGELPNEVDNFGWYRFSQINRYQAWEYSGRPEIDPTYHEGHTISLGIKPLSNNCDCWTWYTGLHRVGRFGLWKKGVLTHHAYNYVREVCYRAM